MNHFSESEPLDIDLVSNEAPMTLFFNHLRHPHPPEAPHLSYTFASHACFYTTSPLPPPFSLPPTLPLALVPAEHPFMCLKCGAQKMKVCVRGEVGVKSKSPCMRLDVCARKCVVATCCVRGSLSGPDGQKKSTKRSDWGCGGGGGGGLKLGVEVEGRKGCRNGQEDFPSLFI